jgi:hypothetical protein
MRDAAPSFISPCHFPFCQPTLPAMKSLLVLLLLAAPVFAQTPTAPAAPAATAPTPTGTNTSRPLFRCTLPGGVYEVAVGAIIAVTSHEYVVDGAARVTEVNIDTAGSLLARFYFLEPAKVNAPAGLGAGTIEKAQQLFQEAANRSGQDVWKKVVKNYPTTTHARTVEYRLNSIEDLNKIFSSAEEAFRLGKNTMIKVGE